MIFARFKRRSWYLWLGLGRLGSVWGRLGGLEVSLESLWRVLDRIMAGLCRVGGRLEMIFARFQRRWCYLGSNLNRLGWGLGWVLGGSWAGPERPEASLEALGWEPGPRGANQTPATFEKWLKCVRVVQF